MTYHVTELDIRRGKPFEPGACPIAHALNRVHPNKGILVTSRYVIIGNREIEMPERLKAFIRAFDAGEAVNPIRFEL